MAKAAQPPDALGSPDAEHARLLQIIDQTPSAVVVTDLSRRITWVNAGFERMTGWWRHEVLGRSPGELLRSPHTDPAAVARLREALDAGQPVQCDLVNRRRDGSDFWLELRIEPLLQAGRHVGFLATELDITDRVLAQSALRAREAELARSGRLARIGGWSLQPGTGSMQWSPQAVQLLDLPKGSLPTWTEFLAWVEPASRAEVEAIAAPQSGAAEWDLSLPICTRLGRPRWFRLFAQVGHDGPRVDGVLQDVTVQYMERQRAARDAQVLRSALEAIDEAFVLFDPEDRLVDCNEKYRDIYAPVRDVIAPGATFETIIRTWAERGHCPAAEGRVAEWVAQRLEQHRAGDSTVIQALDDGRVMRIVERRSPDGYLVGFRFDITELVRARETAEAHARRQSEFVANVSHELRTPLQAILGFSELALLELEDAGSPLVPMLRDIHLGGQRMLTLVNGLLDIFRLEGDVVQLSRTRVDLSELLVSVTHELQPLADKRQLRFALPQVTGPQVEADAFRMEQVLRNLLANALRYAPVGSAIEIGLAQGADGTRVSVRDHGPGMPPEMLESIFQPFSQAGSTPDGTGTGLGLAISRSIMAAHRGSLHASLPDGGGACFTLWLPPD